MQWQRIVKKESRGYTTETSNALALSSSHNHMFFKAILKIALKIERFICHLIDIR